MFFRLAKLVGGIMMIRYYLNKIADYIYKHPKLIVVGIIMFVFSLTVVFNSKSSGMQSDASTRNQKYFTCITIEYGATLTDIANRYVTEEYSSINDYIEEVMNINNLTSDNITSGATLVVPYYSDPIEN